MNSGKTTTAAHLVRGLCLAGINVGAAKTTGTGAGGDVWLLSDAGAFPVYDFTNAGYPGTYLIGPDAVRDVFTGLTDRLAADGCQVVVLEVADGVFREETACPGRHAPPGAGRTRRHRLVPARGPRRRGRPTMGAALRQRPDRPAVQRRRRVRGA
jgi:hypothetical protein